MPGEADRAKPERVRALLAALPEADVVLPVQALGELYRVLAGKARLPPEAARQAVLAWADLYAPVDTSAAVMLAAADLAATHRLSIWDATILAAAAEAGARLLLSEDLQEGFTWRGVTVTNPLAAPLHPLLEAKLARG